MWTILSKSSDWDQTEWKIVEKKIWIVGSLFYGQDEGVRAGDPAPWFNTYTQASFDSFALKADLKKVIIDDLDCFFPREE